MSTKPGLERAAHLTEKTLSNEGSPLSLIEIFECVDLIAQAEGFDTIEGFLWRLTQDDSLLLNLNDLAGAGAVAEDYPAGDGYYVVTVNCEYVSKGELD